MDEEEEERREEENMSFPLGAVTIELCCMRCP